MIWLFAVAFCASAFIRCSSVSSEFDSLYEGLPFDMPVVERSAIPSYEVDVTDFGAVGDGRTLNSEAFAVAVEHLSANGGGHLVVPQGIWLTGPITLKDNIDLHITKNAVLLFSTDRSLYPIINTVFEGLDTKRCLSPINADGAKNISITGGGTVDGQGDSWRKVRRFKVAPLMWKSLLEGGGLVNSKGDMWFPDSSSFRGYLVSDVLNVPRGLETDEEWNSVKTYLRPVLVCLKNCENVLIEDCVFQNSPCWNIHPLMCRNVIVKNITVKASEYAENTDGIDFDSCENALLLDSVFDVGDDAICIKSGKDTDGRKRARPCSNIIVYNCTAFHGHGGFVIGSEMSGDVRNILVRKCNFFGTDAGFRFKSCRGRGGVVENIYASDIIMTDIPTEPLLFDLHYVGKSVVDAEMAERKGGTVYDIEPEPVDETTPEFRNIHIKDVICNGANRAMYFNGIPEKHINDIYVENFRVSSVLGADLRFSTGVILKNVCIDQKRGPAYFLSNCHMVTLDGCMGDGGRTAGEFSVERQNTDFFDIK